MEIERILKANCDAHSLVAVQPQGEYWVRPRDPTLLAPISFAVTSPPCAMQTEPHVRPSRGESALAGSASSTRHLHP